MTSPTPALSHQAHDRVMPGGGNQRQGREMGGRSSMQGLEGGHALLSSWLMQVWQKCATVTEPECERHQGRVMSVSKATDHMYMYLASGVLINKCVV